MKSDINMTVVDCCLTWNRHKHCFQLFEQNYFKVAFDIKWQDEFTEIQNYSQPSIPGPMFFAA